ncbi:MAG: insulinase family protein [Polaribacter sp.]|nr:insulinase family protein [Polaribacter sp.]MDG1810759.1 insulinase family protein [Polaribacter sp.]MDG1994765.1 insulinase family protein [Polaribacter sp.]
MKTKIVTLIAIFAMSFAVSAQIDRSKQPKSGPTPSVKLGKTNNFTLKNGLKVIIVENHKLPRASASLRIDNRPYAEGNKAGLSSVMGILLGRGTPSITKDAFNEEVDFLGANVGFGSSSAFASSLKRYFPKVLGLMADGVKNSLFTQEELDKQVKVILDNIKNSEKNVTSAARRVENLLTYGKNHPYGEFTSKETVGNITLADVKNNFNTYYKPNNAYLIISGDINTKEMKKLVQELFGDWEKGEIPLTSLVKPTNVAHTVIDFIDMPNAVQSEIAAINNIDLTLASKDYYAALLANSILGGGGSARLFNNLREDKGYTYGSYSSISQSRYAATFRATASVRNMVTDSSVVEMQKEINKIRFNKVTETELKDAKAAYIGSFVMNVQKPAVAANFALNIAMYNLPKDYYENYLANVNSVTLEDVQKAAYKYFKGDKNRIIITGKGSEVLENLEKLKYKINYYDKYGNPTEKPKMDMPIPVGMTATNIVDNYFKAIGGEDKVNAVKTILSKADATIQGMKINLTSKTAAPNKVSIVVSGMGQTLSKQIFDGEKGYAEGQGRRMDLNAAQIEEAKKSLLFVDKVYKAGKLDRIANLDGVNAYVITFDKKEIFYNAKTGLKIQEVVSTTVNGKEVKTATTFADYKAINGILFPHKTTMPMGPMKLEFVVSEIKINEDVSEADFKM